VHRPKLPPLIAIDEFPVHPNVKYTAKSSHQSVFPRIDYHLVGRRPTCIRIATPQTFISSEPRNTNNIPSRLATCNFPISTPARPFSILAWPLCDHCWCQHMQISRVHGRLQQTTRHKIFLSRSRRQDTTSCGNLEPGFIELKWHEANTGTKSHVAFVSATSKCHFSQLEVTQSVGVFAPYLGSAAWSSWILSKDNSKS
jgi:hypothetical protein